MTTTKETNYNLLGKQLASLIEDETNLIAILSNTSALLNDNLDQINWVGFYLIENNELILGPFQGHPACVHISIEKGVCGTANSKSEIVVPIHVDNEIIGVLDIDAPITQRFSKGDQQGLEEIVSILEHQLSK